MASEVTLRRHSKRELLAMVERGLAVQDELWRLQAQHEVRGQIVAEQADQLAACRDEIARLTAALDAREREAAALREALEGARRDVLAVYENTDEGSMSHMDYYQASSAFRARLGVALDTMNRALAAPPQRPATGEGE